MDKQKYDKINEVLYSHKLSNGLKVFVVPKENFTSVYATFVTHFGSINNRFIPYGEEKYVEVPLGVAHFLEHKMFEMEDGKDAIQLFADLGAEANAFTDYEQTAYIATTTTNTKEVINLLIDFVQTPVFIEESIKKEQGIITQELMMYLDRPSSRAHVGIMQNMFRESPIREDIVGTKESIAAINKEVLNKCYNTFYHPSNMMLMVVGNVDPEVIIKTVEENQNRKVFNPPKDITKEIIIEDNQVNIPSSSITMDIVMPKVAIGIKLPHIEYEPNQLMVDELKIKMILENTFGVSSSNYQEMLDKEIFNTGFSYSVTLSHYYNYIIITANTLKPEEFKNYIKEKILGLQNFSIDEEEFMQMKRALIGSFIKSYNHLDFIAHAYIDYKVKNCDLFNTLSLLENIKSSDLDKFKQYFTEKAITDFTIYTK
ncbi:MAG TPA: insulinase family protein [Acholeplasmataceae bacterium]|nr:insulinase family protein [Acholeplasmataceae bacterium]